MVWFMDDDIGVFLDFGNGGGLNIFKVLGLNFNYDFSEDI